MNISSIYHLAGERIGLSYGRLRQITLNACTISALRATERADLPPWRIERMTINGLAKGSETFLQLLARNVAERGNLPA